MTPSADAPPPGAMTHLGEAGEARMVDIGDKLAGRRTAVAAARVEFAPGVLAALLAGNAAKGDALGTARIAAIQAAKRTSELIPLCHPLRLDAVELGFEATGEALEIRATVRATDRTGVEMEALVAATTAALVVYDMTKSLSKATTISAVRLLSKTGGKSGDWVAPERGTGGVAP